MRIILAGPGRAGTSLALALRDVGHDIVGVLGRRPEAAAEAAALLGAEVLEWDRPLAPADLIMVAVRDDAIAGAAGRLAPHSDAVAAAFHLSGLAGLEPLQTLAEAGLLVGSLHPLQTLPDPVTGASRLDGAWAAIDASNDELRRTLAELAESIGMRPFDLAPEMRRLYHAAAAAAANFPLAALAMAQDLFAAAGVPFAAAGPLTSAVVGNAFAMGPRSALTGPVARGDVGTVQAQLEAIGAEAPEWLDHYRAMVRALAQAAGRGDEFSGLVAE